jgi:AcrR family transcriptional regulator
MDAGGRPELAVLGSAPRERADAARNRRKILTAAARLLAARGAEGLTMDEVAAAAGVGTGTVYRRFGDIGGLAHALLSERERRLQSAILHGPPPLGPGAPPDRRIRAFLHALLDRIEEQTGLLLVAETSTPHARYSSGAYAVHHSHLATLLAEARPDADAHYLADALLAPLAASLLVHQWRDRRMDTPRIKRGLDSLLDGALHQR